MDSIEHQPANLPEDAVPAWRCYEAMNASKQAHFAFLETLELKYQNGGSRTLAEAAHQEGLLAEHNACVKAFVAAQKSLASSNAEAHKRFIALLAEYNAHIGATTPQ